MEDSPSLARRILRDVLLFGGALWLISGAVLWWAAAGNIPWGAWLLVGAVLFVVLKLAIERWITHTLGTALDEIKLALDALSMGHRRSMRRSNLAELDAIARGIDRVADRIEAIEQSVEYLQRVRSQFLANVSHELRTPLFTIAGYIETLLDGAIDDPSVARTFLEKVHANVDRLSTLLGDLIEIARIESGEMRMSFRYFDVVELARNTVEHFAGLAEQQNVQLEVVAGDQEVLVYGDRERIGQVLSNLVSNAIKYNVPGGRVTVRIERNDGRSMISVEDTGIGIAPEHQARVFERFYRTDAARSRSVGGSGLGLAIVKHILEAHRAPFELHSQIGEGTTIRFWLKS
ncbi:MAG: ATP-binding protein [Chlorobi bacterium]|nr:ATP-binding protein [Chlorobiota bacterium]